MKDFILNNYQWIFSGIGVSILFFFLNNKSVRDKLKLTKNRIDRNSINISHSSGTSVEIVNNKTIISDISKSELNKKIKNLSEPSSKELLNKLIDIPPFQRNSIIDHYIGIKVTWSLKYYDITEVSENKYKVHSSGGVLVNVIFEIDINQYMEFKILKENAKLIVTGIIKSIDSGLRIIVLDLIEASFED